MLCKIKGLLNYNIRFKPNFKCEFSSDEKLIPKKVLVTGAAGQIAYSILPLIANGGIWGDKQKVILKMLDIEKTKNIMDGVKMELEDCSFKTLKKVEIFTDSKEALPENDVIIMLANTFNITADMTRFDLLNKNIGPYAEAANVLNDKCNKNTKILVIANPCNSIALFLAEKLQNVISTKNFSSLSRIDHNRTKNQLSHRLGIPCYQIRKNIIWGNHSGTMYPDVRFVEVLTPNGWQKSEKLMSDTDWIQKTLVPTVRTRGFDVLVARNKSAGFTPAYAALEQLKSWLIGTPEDEWVSMAVYNDSTNYVDIPQGVVFSHPVICKDGNYEIVKDLVIDEKTSEMLKANGKELLAEKDAIAKLNL